MYKNTYTPPIPAEIPSDTHAKTPKEEYDFNYALLTQPIQVLEGPGRDVRLEPFVPSIYAEKLYIGAKDHPELVRYLPFDLWQSVDDVNIFLEEFFRREQSRLLYAIIDKKTETFAGMISWINSSPIDLTSEIGFVFILPPAQRTHVLTHSVSLLLEHGFNLPSDGGLGLRRIQWQANELNLPSTKAALRLGFVLESPIRIRLQRTVKPGKEGSHSGRQGDGLYEAGRMSRNTNILSLTYIDWLEDGKREHVQSLVERKPKA
ncbi:GNAT domain [Phaffia rhodozyma]|uniref:GNAT domain n=1 Tax=Phaffia rhodozyma TaxID=264483 RepID=A0A0F7SRZ1_PHARH|nr:GNAT domain [Phaffia rhodozyma]